MESPFIPHPLDELITLGAPLPLITLFFEKVETPEQQRLIWLQDYGFF